MNDELITTIIYELLQRNESKHTLYDVVHIIRPRRGKLLTLFTFSAFVLVFLFYFQYNKLLALFVFLLFLFWYSRSDINIFSKRYKGSEAQKINCFNDAQNLILKGKYDKAKEVMDLYRNKFNDQEAMILYNFLLFIVEDYDLFIDNLRYMKDVHHDGFNLLYGISLVLTENTKQGITVLNQVMQVSETLLLVKKYYLAKAFVDLGEKEHSQSILDEIIHTRTQELFIVKMAKELLEDRSDEV